MHLTFTRGAKTAEIPVYGPCTLKFYAVPAAYSEDGFFAAVWAKGELEPVPACGPSDAALLAHLELEAGEDGAITIRKLLAAGGVSYAAH